MTEQLELKRISKLEIVNAINAITYQQKYPYHSDLRIADKQLQADQIVLDNVNEQHNKETAELKEELEYMYEAYEVAIEVLDTECKAEIREILDELEPPYHDSKFEALKHKYLGESNG